MKKFGLIGYPIGHSVSPAVFAAGYKGRPYSYDLIEGEDFEESWRRFIEEYDGINVTAPFKEPAFAKADIHSPECEDIGATNLLIKTPEGIKAYNSDYYGIVFSILLGCGVDVAELPATPSKEQCREALRAVAAARQNSRGGNGENNAAAARKDTAADNGAEAAPDTKAESRLKSALIVGCGGAGKAAVAAAVNLGLKTTLMNRSVEKAFATAARASKALKNNPGQSPTDDTRHAAVEDHADNEGSDSSIAVRPLEDFAECFQESDLVIYALPCPIDALETLAGGPQCRNDSLQDNNTPQDNAAPQCHSNTAQDAAGEECTEAVPKKLDGKKGCCGRKLVIEANYRNPSFTPDLIARLQARYPAAEFMRGNIWHLYQAWSGYKIFTGESPDLAAMAEVDR